MAKLKYDIDQILTGEKQAWDKPVPSFTNEFETGFAGARTLDQIRNLGTGTRALSVDVGDSIQDAIDKLNETGGGIVQLRNGTHQPPADLILYSDITLTGENASATTIDFQNGAFGIKVIGTDAYSTGTISVTNGSTTVTGSGTSWSSNVVAGQRILLSGLWYPISAVGSDTSITLAIPYADATLSGASYSTATVKDGWKIINMTITRSLATSAIDIQYANEYFMQDVAVNASANGIRIQNSSQSSLRDLDMIANATNWIMTDMHYAYTAACGAIDATTGHGVTMNGVTKFIGTAFFVLNSAGDGINLTDCSDILLSGISSENGGQGIEFVSGNDNIAINSVKTTNNTSDGIKLTATSDNIRIVNSPILDNGGYGVNIAASSCDNTIITANNFSGNSSGPDSDSGTGTVIRGNVGLDDNSAGAFGSLIFGGDGSDGALTVSSGTTTIDLGGEPVVTKNYTSISITGTGVVDFSNPHDNGTIVILKSQGDVTLTSSATPMLDLQGIGAQGVATANGNAGRIAAPLYVADFGEVGQDGQNGANSTGGVAGSGQNSTSPVTVYATLAQIGDYAIACGGAGGAGGDNQTGDGSPGIGGDGGGGLVIECRGALNFTTSSGISVAGSNGATGAAATDGTGGGGGGAGGTALVLYNTLTAASGSITVSGGTGGTGATGDSGTPGAGGAGGNGSSGSGNGGTGGQGGSASGAGGSGGGAGGGGGAYFFGTSNGSVGSAGTNTGATNQAPGGGGGGGASGYAVITQNKGRS